MPLSLLPLRAARAAIDRVDDGLVLLLAARRRLVSVAARAKARAGHAPRDAQRERDVAQRAQRLAGRVGVPADTARSLALLAIGDACRQQGFAPNEEDIGAAAGSTADTDASPRWHDQALRLLPPPRGWAPLLRALPERWRARLLERAIGRVLSGPAAAGALEFMRGRRLGIEVSDLDLRCTIGLHEDGLRVEGGAGEATVRGAAVDLLLLAGRLEDADTLFFQRRLVLTGDTELGLTARNLLEGLPWEAVPLGLRIALNRGARLARRARDAYRGEDWQC